jgi:hypothetical protein
MKKGKNVVPVKFLSLIILSVLILLPFSGEGAVSVIGGLTRETSVTPGGKYPGSVIVKNVSDEPEEIKIYQTDFLSYADGSQAYDDPGTMPRSNAKWITFAPVRIIIAPRDTATIHYEINVPEDKTMTGTYWSLLMVEMVGQAAPESDAVNKNEATIGIQQVFRYAIQIVTNFGDSGNSKLKLDAALLKKEGKRIFQVDAENTGDRWLRPFLWMELYDDQGNHIGRFEGNRIRVYPGTSARGTIDLSELPEGTYKATLIADGGGQNVFGANYTLKFESM